ANHDSNNLNDHLEGKDVRLGKNCWLGMNSVILPGVSLGDNTIVGAGSIVTKSFDEGNVVIAGNPAKIVKQLV
ncbi:acyltransferase, partial [Staphylococcus cohnii]